VASHENGLFVIDVFVDNVFLGRGCAKSKKQAEQYAAQAYFYPPTHLKGTHHR
jgi:ribonuclease-3